MRHDDKDIGTWTTNLIASELDEGRRIGLGASSKRVEKRNKDD